MHPYIAEPYIIVTHGEFFDGMRNNPQEFLDDSKIIAWFGIHPDSLHPKYHPVPLGIWQHPEYCKPKKKWDDFFSFLRKNSEKKSLLYLNFAETNPERPERAIIRAFFSDKPFCKVSSNLPYEVYLSEMAQCKFALSPAGLGPDCYRTWESLLVGTIPIVKKSLVDPLFEGLPVLIIDTWDDITEEFLNKKYIEMTQKKYDLRKLYIEYWFSKIIQIQEKFLTEQQAHTQQ